MKPSFTNDEGSDLLDYRRVECEFPHHSTADQFYDATRFESYRQLGLHMSSDLCNQLVKLDGASLEEKLTTLFAELSRPSADMPSVKKSMLKVSETLAGANQTVGKIAALFSGDGNSHKAEEVSSSAVHSSDGQDGRTLSNQIDMYSRELWTELGRIQVEGTPVAQEKLGVWDAFINQCLQQVTNVESSLSTDAVHQLRQKTLSLMQVHRFLSEHSSRQKGPDIDTSRLDVDPQEV
jgi:hypothetical protein